MKKNKTKKWKQKGVSIKIDITNKEEKRLKKLSKKFSIPVNFLQGILFSSMLAMAAEEPDAAAELLGLETLKDKYSGLWMN